MGAAEGEAVDARVVSQFKSLSSSRLLEIRSGLSDQKVALIDTIIASRRSGTTLAPTKQLVKRFEESRSVAEVRGLEEKRIEAIQLKARQESQVQTLDPSQLQTRDPRQVSLQIERREVQPSDAGFFARARAEASTETARGKGTLRTQVLGSVVGLAASLESTLEFGRQVFREPKKTAKGFVETGKQLVTGELDLSAISRTIMEEPSFAFGFLIGEVTQAEVGGKVLTKAGEFADVARTRVSPKFKPIEKIGDEKFIRNVKVSDRELKIKLIPSAKSEQLSLKQQAAFSGIKDIEVITAQKDLFDTFTRREITVKKPIPSEEILSKTTRKQLRRFDEGKLNNQQITELNRRIIKETKGKGSLLERSLFFSPPIKGKLQLRTSRLGLEQKTGGILDLIRNEAEFVRQKPQAIISRVDVAKLPKNIKRKLDRGISLNLAEQEQLLIFQLEATGKAKPIGALSREPEFTLPKEILRREETLGVTIIEGRRVEIFRGEIVQASPKTKKLLARRPETLSSKEIRDLERNLRKESGFDISSQARPSGKFVSPTGLSLSISSSVRKISREIRISSSRSPTRKAPRQPSRPKITRRIERTSLSSLGISKSDISSPRLGRPSGRAFGRPSGRPIQLPRVTKIPARIKPRLKPKKRKNPFARRGQAVQLASRG